MTRSSVSASARAGGMRLGCATALAALLVAVPAGLRAQEGPYDPPRRGGHHGGSGKAIGIGVAGVVIGIGVAIIADSVRRENARAERQRRAAARDEADGPVEPRRRPRVVRATPADAVQPGRERPQRSRRAEQKPPRGGRPPAGPAVPPAASGAPSARSVARAGVVPNEVLCEIRAGTSDDEIAAIGRRQRLERVSIERFGLTGATIVRYRIRDRRPIPAAIADLTREPAIASVQPNNVFELSQSVADLSQTQYATAMMRLAEAHQTATGAGVGVAVVDSAVDPGHPALKGAIRETFDPIGGPSKAHAHGTAVAGLAAGRGSITSPAPRADIYAVRAFAPDQAARPGAQGTTMHILRGLDWAAARGVKVVNMSFAGPKDAKISAFIAAGAARGMIHVAAAGNAGPASQPLYPAADPNVIAVTAIDSAGGLLDVANRGAHLSVAAPGVDVLVAAPGGGFGYLSGTSMASAGVAGLVALMAQASPGLPAWRARAALTASARDLGEPGPDPMFGAGSVDARGALDALGAPGTPEASNVPAVAPPPTAAATEPAIVTPAAAPGGR